MNTHIDRQATPLWAALGAPLVGVPLLVGFLALVAPDAKPENDGLVRVEQTLEAELFDHPVDVEARDFESMLREG